MSQYSVHYRQKHLADTLRQKRILIIYQQCERV
jgi:hypothetical protein